MEEDDEAGERRGYAVAVADSNVRPRHGEVASEELLGDIPMSGGDHMRVKWVNLKGSWPILSIWFYRPGPDGTWFPIRDRGIRVNAPRVRALLDILRAAEPLEAEWREYDRRRHNEKRRETYARAWARRGSDPEPPPGPA